MYVLLTGFIALCALGIAQSKVIMIQESPITAEGLSIRISLKEDTVSGRQMASVKLYMDDKSPQNMELPMKHKPLIGDIIPDVETRFAMKDGKCPKGTVLRRNLCTPR